MANGFGCIDYTLSTLLLVSLVLCIYLIFYTNDDLHLYNRYNKNWNSKYITDLKFITGEEKCSEGYELINLGLWSGFTDGTTVCKNKYVPEIFIDDYNYEDNTNVTYNCQKVTGVGSVNLTEFRKTRFCIKRSERSLIDFSKNKLNFTDDNEYFKAVVENQFPIDKNAIIDIKILDPKGLDDFSKFIGFKIEDYENIYKGNFSVFIKRFNKETANVYQISNFIVDIHLYNHLMCSYLDIATPNGFYYDVRELDFGYSNCNSMQKGKDWFFNDGGKRSIDIFIDKYTRKDIYPDIILNAYSTININKFNEIIPTKLVYERYFYGLGCKDITLDEHLSKLSSNLTIRNLCIALLSIQCVLKLCSIIYSCFKAKQNRKYTHLFLFFTMGLIGLSIFLSFTAGIIANKAAKHFYYYEFWCQKDFSGVSFDVNKVSSMEIDYKQNFIPWSIQLFALMILQGLAGFFSIIGFLNNCCCWKENAEADNRQVFEMRSNTDGKNDSIRT